MDCVAFSSNVEFDWLGSMDDCSVFCDGIFIAVLRMLFRGTYIKLYIKITEVLLYRRTSSRLAFASGLSSPGATLCALRLFR